MWAMNWRKLLAMALFLFLSGQLIAAHGERQRLGELGAFRERVMEAFRKAPGVKTVVPDAGDPAKLTVNMSDSLSLVTDVSNIYRYLNAYPKEDVDAAIQRLVRASVGGGKEEISEGNIVVVLGTREYTDFVSRAMRDEAVVEPLVADLMVLYMADLPDSMQPCTRKEAEKLDGVDLHQMAQRNVRQFLPKVQLTELGTMGALFAVKGNEMLSPSLILFDEFWDSIKDRFPGDVLIAVPRNDQLFIFDAENPGSEKAARALIRVTMKEGFNLLSDKLLARRGGRIVEVP